MNVSEMEGFLRGKCLPGDIKVNESNAEYLVRKLSAVSELQGEVTALVATLGKSREVSGCPEGIDLQDWVKQLAAESLAMKQAIDQHRCGFVVCPSCSLEISSSTDDVCYVLDGTPATDRIVAGIKADGVEMFALMFAEEAIKDNNITTGWKARASRAASEYADLLREGADK